MEICAKEDGWQYDCLIYDGALLRKRSDKTIRRLSILNALMRSTGFAIKERHGIEISLVQKELQTGKLGRLTDYEFDLVTFIWNVIMLIFVFGLTERFFC